MSRVYKIFDIQIPTANAVYSQVFDLDKTIVAIWGILFTSDRDDMAYYRGSARIEINRTEVFPENYETKLLMSGLNVSPNDRYYNLKGLPPGNGKIKIDYRDTDSTQITFSAYRVSLYVECEMIDA